MGQFQSPYLKKDITDLEKIQKRTTEMIKGLERPLRKDWRKRKEGSSARPVATLGDHGNWLGKGHMGGGICSREKWSKIQWKGWLDATLYVSFQNFSCHIVIQRKGAWLWMRARRAPYQLLWFNFSEPSPRPSCGVPNVAGASLTASRSSVTSESSQAALCFESFSVPGREDLTMLWSS